MLLQRLVCWLFLLQATTFADETYTINDDASWAIRSNHLSQRLGDKQALYNRFIDTCQQAVGERRNCGEEDQFRLSMNSLQVSR